MAVDRKVGGKNGRSTIGFTRDHLWLRVDGQRAKIGVSDYARSEFGEVIAAELPDVGDEIEKGETFGELECIPTAFALVAPISGTVRAVNTEVDDEPTAINEDPYHEGWLIEVTVRDEEEIDVLMDIHEYEAFVAGESDD